MNIKKKEHTRRVRIPRSLLDNIYLAKRFERWNVWNFIHSI